MGGAIVKLLDLLNDFVLDIGYCESDVMAAIDNRVVVDHLFHGPSGHFGLKRYLGKKETAIKKIKVVSQYYALTNL